MPKTKAKNPGPVAKTSVSSKKKTSKKKTSKKTNVSADTRRKYRTNKLRRDMLIEALSQVTAYLGGWNKGAISVTDTSGNLTPIESKTDALKLQKEIEDELSMTGVRIKKVGKKKSNLIKTMYKKLAPGASKLYSTARSIAYLNSAAAVQISNNFAPHSTKEQLKRAIETLEQRNLKYNLSNANDSINYELVDDILSDAIRLNFMSKVWQHKRAQQKAFVDSFPEFLATSNTDKNIIYYLYSSKWTEKSKVAKLTEIPNSQYVSAYDKIQAGKAKKAQPIAPVPIPPQKDNPIVQKEDKSEKVAQENAILQQGAPNVQNVAKEIKEQIESGAKQQGKEEKEEGKPAKSGQEIKEAVGMA